VGLDATLTVEGGDAEVEFVLAVTNTGDEAQTLEFRSGRSAEFTVSDDGEVVWRSSDGMMFTQAMRSERLEPGETLTEAATWTEPEPGDYTVEATLDATDIDVTVEESFAV
jgi:hypothetical protein